MMYVIIVLSGVLGFWVVWMLMDRFAAGGKTGAPPPAKAWHELLGVGPDAAEADIRAAYEREIEQYAPGSLTAMNPQARAVAEQHSRELERALNEGLDAARRRA